MKRYEYILILLFLIATEVTAQIKIGNYTFKDGAEYVGELKGRRPHGKGKTTFKSGDIYEGEYVKGIYDFPAFQIPDASQTVVVPTYNT